MAKTYCNKCNEGISEDTDLCPDCADSGGVYIDFSRKIEMARGKEHLGQRPYFARLLGWFVLINVAVIASLAIVSGGALLAFAPFLLILGAVFPLISLFFSKWSAKKAHHMTIIGEGNFQNTSEESLYALIEILSTRAGINKTPQVGIYESEDMNAFATGMHKNNSLVAFSTGLLAKMDEDSIAAVAAHEIAHVANGDMIIMSIVQSVVNAVVLLVTVPLAVFQFMALFSNEIEIFTYWAISLVKFIITSIYRRNIARCAGSLRICQAYSIDGLFLAGR